MYCGNYIITRDDEVAAPASSTWVVSALLLFIRPRGVFSFMARSLHARRAMRLYIWKAGPAALLLLLLTCRLNNGWIKFLVLRERETPSPLSCPIIYSRNRGDNLAIRIFPCTHDLFFPHLHNLQNYDKLHNNYRARLSRSYLEL
jgi:hypothetical protein